MGPIQENEDKMLSAEKKKKEETGKDIIVNHQTEITDRNTRKKEQKMYRETMKQKIK